MRRTTMYLPFVAVTALLVLAAGCRSNGNKAKYWKVDDADRGGAVSSSEERRVYVPERVTQTEVGQARAGQLPSLQMQMASASRSTGNEELDLTGPSGAYILKPGDPLIISLSGPIEKQVEDILDEEGNLNLTYIGTVRAAGKTSTQLEREIERLYLDKKIYKQLSVNVLVPTKHYYIRGYVRGPNRYPLIGRTTLMQAIAAAGGFNEFANPKKITLTRGNNAPQTIDFNAIQKDPSRDIELLPGDSVFVPRSIF